MTARGSMQDGRSAVIAQVIVDRSVLNLKVVKILKTVWTASRADAARKQTLLA